MSAAGRSKPSKVKTWKLQHGLISVEVTAGVLKDKPKAKKKVTKRTKN